VRVVIDAHTVAGRLLAPHGPAAAIFAAWELGALEFAVSEEVLAMYDRLLRNPVVIARTGLAANEVTEFVDGFRRLGVLVEVGGETQPRLEDPATHRIGEPYYACALASSSDLVFAADPRVRAEADDVGVPVLAPEGFQRACSPGVADRRRRAKQRQGLGKHPQPLSRGTVAVLEN
jgi:predicted nucleic acid-binding protein